MRFIVRLFYGLFFVVGFAGLLALATHSLHLTLLVGIGKESASSAVLSLATGLLGLLCAYLWAQALGSLREALHSPASQIIAE